MNNFRGDLSDISDTNPSLVPVVYLCICLSARWHTVGPLVIELLWTQKRVSTGAPGALDNPLVVQTKV